jgi:hypothetical protein
MIVIANDKDPSDLLPSEVIVYSREDGTHGLIMRCPRCNEVTTGDTHKYNKETKSITPSLRHPCGYHGHLTNGEFVDC